MEITSRPYQPDPEGALVLKVSPWSHVFGLAIVATLIVASATALASMAGSMSGFLLVVLVIPAGLTGLILAALFMAFLHSWRASLRPSNWSIQVGSHQLVVNLRDYRNGQPGEDSPVLELDVSDIQNASKVTETWIRQGRDRKMTVSRHFIDLRLQEGDTTELSKVLQKEKQLWSKKHSSNSQSPSTQSRGFRFHGQLAHVVEAGIVRLPYTKKLHSALCQVLPFEEDRQVDLDELWSDLRPIMKARELDKRGERIHALRLLMKAEDLNSKQARELLDGAQSERDPDSMDAA